MSKPHKPAGEIKRIGVLGGRAVVITPEKRGAWCPYVDAFVRRLTDVRRVVSSK
jgi:hypothetical protein